MIIQALFKSHLWRGSPVEVVSVGHQQPCYWPIVLPEIFHLQYKKGWYNMTNFPLRIVTRPGRMPCTSASVSASSVCPLLGQPSTWWTSSTVPAVWSGMRRGTGSRGEQTVSVSGLKLRSYQLFCARLLCLLLFALKILQSCIKPHIHNQDIYVMVLLPIQKEISVWPLKLAMVYFCSSGILRA